MKAARSKAPISELSWGRINAHDHVTPKQRQQQQQRDIYKTSLFGSRGPLRRLESKGRDFGHVPLSLFTHLM